MDGSIPSANPADDAEHLALYVCVYVGARIAFACLRDHYVSTLVNHASPNNIGEPCMRHSSCIAGVAKKALDDYLCDAPFL